MIRKILRNSEYLVIKWYAILHLEQQRMIKLYNDGGITKSIANKELRSIYKWMKILKSIDNFLVILLSKAQTISIQR